MKYTLALLTYIFSICSFSFSQQVTNLDFTNGLTKGPNFNIKQDKKGFIWISNRFGVNRFDGTSIKNYPIDILRNSIPIWKTEVIIDKKQDLWLYTDRGSIYKYDEKIDNFVSIYELNAYICSLYFDSDNCIWAASRHFFGFVSEDSLHKINILPEAEELNEIAEYDDEHLLITCKSNIYIFHIKSRQLTPLISPSLIKKGINIELSYYDRKNDRIWLGCNGSGILIYDIRQQKTFRIMDDQLNVHPVLCMTELDDNYILAGTEGIGVCLINRNTFVIEKYYNQSEITNFVIKGNAVYDIFKDSEERLWISTFGEGIKIADFTQTGFHTIKHQENNPNSLCKDVVCFILEDSDHNIWYGTNSGISLWQRDKNQWTTLLKSKNVLSVFEDSSQRIWVGTYAAGVYVLNKQGVILEHYIASNGEDGIGTNFVYTIQEDSDKNMWFGGKRGSVCKLDLNTRLFTNISVSHASYILVKDEDTMLISTDYGIYEVDIHTLKVTPCPINRQLESRHIGDMFLESDSILWMATYGNGINRYNLNTNQLKTYTEDDGLSSNIIYSLLKDNAHRLWVCSENGLSYIDLNNNDIVNFSVADGISHVIFRQISRAKTHDGYLYFGSVNGVTYFRPDDIIKKYPSGKLSLQEFKLFNKVVHAGEENSPLNDALDNLSEVTLNHRQHSFSINFIGTNYFIGEEKKYMWRLKGFDSEWIGATKEHVANYTNMVPGNYLFEVRYLDGNNRVLDERTLNITITPPFWKTAWAKLIMLALIAGFIYWLYNYISQRIRERQAKEKIDFFISTVHDIRTPLTLVNSPIEELRTEIQSTPKSDYLIGLITTNIEKLNMIFTQLLDFQKAYEKQDKLNLKEVEITEFLTNKVSCWQPAAMNKKIELTLELPEVQVNEWFDMEKLEKIIDNLISNAIKYTPSGGQVRVTLDSNVEYWGIKVSDTGIGISKKDQKQLFYRFYRGKNAINSRVGGSGLGLLLIKQYVSLHKGVIGINSLENKGSEFYVQFKHGKEHFDKQLFDTVDAESIELKKYEEEISLDKRKIRLLIVEDEADLRNYLKESLSHIYNVVTASNGAEAYEVIKKYNPDMVISDLQMPVMDGFELCAKIKSTFETSHIPVILLTVVNEKSYVEKGLTIGADDYIGKPFDLKLLKVKIENIIWNRKLLRLKFLGINKVDAEENEIQDSLNTEFIHKATRILEANLENPLFSVIDLSKELGLSRTLLYSKFNSVTGYTPNEFIKVIRMNKAIEYFREGKYSINEVSLKVGFEEPAYFSTCFKKIYGKTPSAFIEENLK